MAGNMLGDSPHREWGGGCGGPCCGNDKRMQRKAKKKAKTAEAKSVRRQIEEERDVR